jgi:hypothetical protein
MQTAEMDLLDIDPFDLLADEEPFEAEPVAASASVDDRLAATQRLLSRALRIVAEFDEAKHDRDRRGRFSKSAAQVVSELDDLMAKLSALTKDLGDEDDKYDTDAALEALKAVRERHHERANRREATLDTADGEVSMSIDRDGDISLDFDNGGFFLTPPEANQLTSVLDEFRATKLPERTAVEQVELRRVPLGDGQLAVVLWDRGLVEVGPADEIGGKDLGSDVLMLDDLDEAADFADLLEELADRSLGKPVKAKSRRPVRAHLKGLHDQKDDGRDKSLKVDAPKPARKKATPQVRPAAEAKPPAKKATPRKARATSAKADAAVEIEAKFDENQLRNSQGEWSDTGAGGGFDKLNLAGRVDLNRGEKLVASQVIPSAPGDFKMPAAVVDGPQGRELRLGFVMHEDTGSWSAADKGGTVKLGKPEMAVLASKLREIHALGEQRRKVLDAANDDNDDTFAEDVVPGGEWGDIHYYAGGAADGEGGWTVDLRRRPPDAPADWEPDYGYEGDTPVTFGPEETQTFVKLLDQFATAGEVSAAAGADVTPGHDELHHWWTRGKGRALWVKSDEPWTTLVAQLMEHVEGLTLPTAKKWASKWYIEVFGFSAGSDKARVAHGKPPRGKVVGPG